MNMEFFKLINNLAHQNSILDKIMVFFSKDVPYIFMAITAIIFILGIVKKDEDCRKAAVSTVILTAINLFLSFIIGCVYYEDRPLVHNKVNYLYPHVEDASFPSDHATGTMSIALGLGKYNKVLSLVLTLLSVIVGISRVYVGHHYPMDIIGAYIMVGVTNYLYNLKLRSKIDNLYGTIERMLAARLGLQKTYN